MRRVCVVGLVDASSHKSWAVVAMTKSANESHLWFVQRGWPRRAGRQRSEIKCCSGVLHDVFTRSGVDCGDSVAGLAFGHRVAEDEVLRQMQALVGETGAKAVQAIIQSANRWA